MNINDLVRPNILKMKPYSSARDEFKGSASIFLDANENPFDNGLNRYPDPLAIKVKQVIAQQKGIPIEQIFLGNGSDEVIDVLVRIFCEPRVDSIATLPPTYGMYQVSADTSDIEVLKINLDSNFQPEVDKILRGVTKKTKMLFICSPNNPSGNSIEMERIKALLEGFKGIVVIDEAYIDFATQASCTTLTDTYPNLVVTQTFSKAWGLAAIRLGMAFSSKEIIDLMNKIKPPYNVNELTQQAALKALKKVKQKEKMVKQILLERERVAKILRGYDFVENIYPSDANFLLVKVKQANSLYQWLVSNGVVVRSRTNVVLCEECLRITIGIPTENDTMMQVLRESAFSLT
jgi:histidinol-phosphate aminotransferase